MRIYSTGDLHMGQSQHYGKMGRNGISDKLTEQETLLKRFVDECIDNKADLVVFGGDYFPKSHQLNPTSLRVFTRQVLRLSQAGIETDMLEGNHDKSRHENHNSTVDCFDAFNVPHVRVVSKPEVRMIDGVCLIYVPHLIPAELFPYQKNEREGVVEVMGHIITDLIRKAEEAIAATGKTPAQCPRILFGHFGIAEAGRGSESEMIAGNNICVPASLLDREGINLSVLSHIHKFWSMRGKFGNIASIGSMDRFDFAEASDRKVFGKIEIECDPMPSIKLKIIDARPRKFVVIKECLADKFDLSFLDKYDVQDAVVKVLIETATGFAYRKELIDGVNTWLNGHGAYHIHSVVVMTKPTFVSRNAAVVETASVEDNLKATLEGMNSQNVLNLLDLHAELYKVVQAEMEED